MKVIIRDTFLEETRKVEINSLKDLEELSLKEFSEEIIGIDDLDRNLNTFDLADCRSEHIFTTIVTKLSKDTINKSVELVKTIDGYDTSLLKNVLKSLDNNIKFLNKRNKKIYF